MYLTNEILDSQIKAYQKSASDENGKELALTFVVLACHICKYADFPGQSEGIERRCVYEAMERVASFNPKKGKAFNYFTTVILNFLRREYRQYKKVKDLKKKYDPWLP